MPFDTTRPYAYASTVDVLNHLSMVATFTATSRPNATQVHAQLLGVSDELDAALVQADYGVPVATTASQAMNILRQWTSLGAAMHTAAAMPQGQDSKHLAFLERQWTAILGGIRAGDMLLPGLDADTSLSLPRFGSSASGASPYFTRADAEVSWTR